ncbi:DNA damage tolerance protein RHC31 like [Verticillium longisporum]|uniref:DNA damage tolerance protein RHC31 like n=1 Tax=Verticillium longisporum TaxID=100787 RepID=A0A8I3AU37_VERLO|nr:DNA damage tolerance protein RHC31 like [Verticillium longisporum]
MNPRVVVHADAERVQTKGSSYFSAFDIVIATDLDSFTLNIVNTATRLHNKAFYAAGCHGLYGFIFADLIEHDYVIQRELSNVATKLGPETRTRSVVDVQTKKEGGKTIESVTKRELYSTWYLASDVVASLPREYTQTPRRKRAVTPALSCLRALWEFQTLQLGLLSETLRSETLRSFLQSLGGEMAPVAAILGGQLAQDVINVLGQTQQPIQNTVVFDGNTMEANIYPLHPSGALGRGLLSESMPAAMPNGGVALGDPGMMMPMSMDGMDFVGAAPVVTQ